MLENGLTDYQLIRSKRKSLSIQIDHSGAIVVRAPIRLDKSVIESFIKSKKKWIEKKQNLHLSRKKISYKDGEMFYYLGKTYPLELHQIINPLLISMEKNFFYLGMVSQTF